jgi:hypothetical protein
MEASTPVKPLAEAAPGDDPRADAAPRSGALPNLIVIGAQKCGTSVLHYYLSLHPEVSMSKPKELNFFIEERNWPRGVDWYAAHFDAEARVRGEASPNYTAFPQHQGVPERMASVVPDAKLIYMIRDPLERIAAHWVHNYAKRREKGTLAETLTHPNTSYVTRSLYAMQLERFLAYYPKENVLVFQQSELRHQRTETLRRVFEFIGVDPDFHHPRFEHERHQTWTTASRCAGRSSAPTCAPRCRPTHSPSCARTASASASSPGATSPTGRSGTPEPEGRGRRPASGPLRCLRTSETNGRSSSTITRAGPGRCSASG